MATEDLAAVPTEPVSIEEIKAAYPGEWVLIAKPVWDESNLHILSGIPLYHSFDKREIAYLWRDKIKAYGKYTLHFVRPADYVVRPRFIPLISRPIQ